MTNLFYWVSATIFAYGQTSSGKTYTMRGVTEKAVNDIYNHIIKVSIVMIRVANQFFFRCHCSSSDQYLYLFHCCVQTPERDFTIKISGLEIYNENVRDLLNSDSGRALKLLDDPEVSH